MCLKTAGQLESRVDEICDVWLGSLLFAQVLVIQCLRVSTKDNYQNINHMSHNVRKRSFAHVRQMKIQINMRILAVWSGSILSAFWWAIDAKFLDVDNEDKDQTARKHSLILVFVGRTWQTVTFRTLRLISMTGGTSGNRNNMNFETAF